MLLTITLLSRYLLSFVLYHKLPGVFSLPLYGSSVCDFFFHSTKNVFLLCDFASFWSISLSLISIAVSKNRSRVINNKKTRLLPKSVFRLLSYHLVGGFVI